MVKEGRDDIAPLFTTERITPDIADELISVYEQQPRITGSRKQIGFDQISYRSTRFDNVPRRMNIPTPMGYALLCKEVSAAWLNAELSRVESNPSSSIKPQRHADGRVFQLGEYEVEDSGRVVVMGGEDSFAESEQTIRVSAGKKYLVEADIASFFPSIYTHALSWALVGVSEAKRLRNERDVWFNRIDIKQRGLKRNETLGLPIGPATSNILGEAVLYPVDQQLRDMGFEFVRHIDDYKCYCNRLEDAERFIRELDFLLQNYLLSLNAKKIDIRELPLPVNPGWVVDLRHRIT
ncbi:MAG: RNA-directed DNA polymerase, partial [Phycisphaerales bacterium JB065]